MALGTGRRRGRVQRKTERNAAVHRPPDKHEWPINRTIRRIIGRYRVFSDSVDHARGRVRITHRATHDGRRTSLADSRTAARHRRQLRGGHDRAGRRQFVGRRGGRRGLCRGLRATTAATTEAAAPATSSASSISSGSSPTATSAAPTSTTGGGGTAASAAGGGGTTSSAASATSSAAPSPATGARTAAEALALTETPGADRAAATPARRAADVPQTDPQTAEERAVAGVPDSAHHRPGGVRRCRAATAIIPLTWRDACPNGSY